MNLTGKWSYQYDNMESRENQESGWGSGKGELGVGRLSFCESVSKVFSLSKLHFT